MSSPVLDTIKSAYPPGCVATATPWNGSRFVAGLVSLYRPRLVVEVGTDDGATAAFLVDALLENGVGRYVGYEVNAGKAAETAAKLSSAFPGGPWSVVCGDFHETYNGDVVDLAFIDHEPKSDYGRAIDHLRLTHESVIVAHDAVYAEADVHALRVRLADGGWQTITFKPERGFLVAVRP